MRGWLGRSIRLVERFGLAALLMALCLALSGLGLGACYLLLTTGLETLDARLVYLLTAFAVIWTLVWLYMLGVVVASLLSD